MDIFKCNQNMDCVSANTTECDFKMQLDEILATSAFDLDFTIKDLCRAMLVSRTSLHRKVTECIGMSISIYIRIFRLNKAIVLLQTTPQSVSNIAYEVGFSNLAYFSRCFKAQFGKSPSEFRQKN